MESGDSFSTSLSFRCYVPFSSFLLLSKTNHRAQRIFRVPSNYRKTNFDTRRQLYLSLLYGVYFTFENMGNSLLS